MVAFNKRHFSRIVRSASVTPEVDHARQFVSIVRGDFELDSIDSRIRGPLANDGPSWNTSNCLSMHQSFRTLVGRLFRLIVSACTDTSQHLGIPNVDRNILSVPKTSEVRLQRRVFRA